VTISAGLDARKARVGRLGKDSSLPKEGGIWLGVSSPGFWSVPVRGATRFEGSPQSLV